MKRTYKLRRRAETQEQTRQKIVEAAIELHQAKGLAATSFSDIANRAKVGKVTVYRHFPDDPALLSACSGLYFARNPLPEIGVWQQVDDADERLRHGLLESYRYHRQTEPMLARVLPEARDLAIMEPYHRHWDKAAEILAQPFEVSREDGSVLKAALALALSFETWRLLAVRHGLSDEQAVGVTIRLVSQRNGTS